MITNYCISLFPTIYTLSWLIIYVFLIVRTCLVTCSSQRSKSNVIVRFCCISSFVIGNFVSFCIFDLIVFLLIRAKTWNIWLISVDFIKIVILFHFSTSRLHFIFLLLNPNLTQTKVLFISILPLFTFICRIFSWMRFTSRSRNGLHGVYSLYI